MSSGYAITSTKQAKSLNTVRPKRRKKQMKLSLKQRIRNWLINDDPDMDEVCVRDIEPASLDSDGMRLQIYKASGGFVVETRRYDRHKDQNFNTMHVITEEQDLGEALGKIVMMEALRG